MANISWTSSSINSFFNTSLGNPSYNLSGIYNSLNDAALIKSGSYYKLMDSYYKTVKSSDETTTSTTTDTKTEETTTEKTSSRKSTVMDELLSHETKSSVIKNTVLDDLLSDEKKDSAASTYDSTGNKTQTAAATTIDQSI